MAETRRLYLLRHAQAVSEPPDGGDYARPLDAHGEADATALGALLARRGIAPSAVISSGSARTRGTWACLERAGIEAPVRWDDALYEGGEEAYRAAAERTIGDRTLLLGHNPAIRSFAGRMAVDGDEGAMRQLAGGFPKCGLAVFRISGARGAPFFEAFLVPPFPHG